MIMTKTFLWSFNVSQLLSIKNKKNSQLTRNKLLVNNWLCVSLNILITKKLDFEMNCSNSKYYYYGSVNNYMAMMVVLIMKTLMLIKQTTVEVFVIHFKGSLMCNMKLCLMSINFM